MKRYTRHNRGFTLLELLVVLTILSILMTISVWMYAATLPQLRLQGSASAVKGVLSLARLKAGNDGNQWFVEFNLANGSWIAVDDDGYRESTGWRREMYNPLDTVHYNQALANNGVNDVINPSNGGDEVVYRGRLGSGIRFLVVDPNYVSITKVTFYPDGTALVIPPNSGDTIWFVGPNYINYQPGDRNGYVHRRGIQILSSGSIQVVQDVRTS